jgi:hypothetical protein
MSTAALSIWGELRNNKKYPPRHLLTATLCKNTLAMLPSLSSDVARLALTPSLEEENFFSFVGNHSGLGLLTLTLVR